MGIPNPRKNNKLVGSFVLKKETLDKLDELKDAGYFKNEVVDFGINHFYEEYLKSVGGKNECR